MQASPSGRGMAGADFAARPATDIAEVELGAGDDLSPLSDRRPDVEEHVGAGVRDLVVAGQYAIGALVQHLYRPPARLAVDKQRGHPAAPALVGVRLQVALPENGVARDHDVARGGSDRRGHVAD